MDRPIDTPFKYGPGGGHEPVRVDLPRRFLPRTELAAAEPADACQKLRMEVAIFDGDAVTEAMAVCSLAAAPGPPEPSSGGGPAAAGPTWSAVARVASVSTLTECTQTALPFVRVCVSQSGRPPR